MEEIAALVEPHIPALRRYAWALLRSDSAADDLVQDCLERAIGRWHLRRPDGDLRAWLFTIMHNQFVSARRRDRRRGVEASIDSLASEPATMADQESVLAVHDVLDALRALPDEQRVILLLVGVEAFSYQEAADILGIPIGTVMSRLSRGRERLRLLLDAEGKAAVRRVK
ncbi:MAG: sigma-70 family RNA polymerase sigma factor [Kiloniellales bacterium]